MSIPISTIVDIQIARQTTAVGQQSFGTALILGEHSLFTERIKYVNDLSGVTGLGFNTSDVEYRLAQAIFSQTPRPTRLAIGRKEVNVQGVIRVQFSGPFVTGNVINLNINGLAIDPVTFTTDNATTFTALETAIEDLTDFVSTSTSSSNGVNITFLSGVDPLVSDVSVTGGASQPTATITVETVAKTYASELDKLVLESEDWYALLLESTLPNDILSAAAWVESHSPTKIMATRSNSADVLNSAVSTDIASKLQAKNYDRTILCYHNVANEFLDAAILGRMLPEDPGAATFKFKSLNGISVDPLTQANYNTVLAKNGSMYLEIGGVDIFLEGKASGGEFIDTIIFIDWLQARMQERIYRLLVTIPKVRYTDSGVAMIQNQIEAQLQEGIVRGGLSDNPPPVVTVPRVASINPNDRANRFLPDITFVATLAGAIHKIQVRGTVTI